MSTLLLINGVPGIGKTTVAWCIAADAPLTLVLDVDAIRSSLSGWADDPQASGLAARDLAAAAAATHLGAGHDVVVPQFLARDEFADRLADVARAAGARFVEVVLVAAPDVAAARFTARGDVPQLAGAVEDHAASADRLAERLARRPDLQRVDAVEGDVDGTAARVRRAAAGWRRGS